MFYERGDLMDIIKQYLLTIISAALICSILKGLVNKASLSGGLVKLLCGVFVTICLIYPLIEFELPDLDQYVSAFSLDSSDVSDQAIIKSKSSLRESIKTQTESYILDKAASVNAALSVEVTLSDDDLPTPNRVVLTGNVSPHAKSRITEYLTDELGIPKENHVWVR